MVPPVTVNSDVPIQFIAFPFVAVTLPDDTVIIPLFATHSADVADTVPPATFNVPLFHIDLYAPVILP